MFLSTLTPLDSKSFLKLAIFTCFVIVFTDTPLKSLTNGAVVVVRPLGSSATSAGPDDDAPWVST